LLRSCPYRLCMTRSTSSHFFVITTVATAKAEQPELAIINHSGPVNGGLTKGGELAKKNLVPLFQLAISSKLESGKPEVDNLDFEIFPDPDQICWTKATRLNLRW